MFPASNTGHRKASDFCYFGQSHHLIQVVIMLFDHIKFCAPIRKAVPKRCCFDV